MSTFRNPAFTLPEYPPFAPDNPPTEAQHGVLGQLDGTWVNAPGIYGIHTTILPAPGSTSEQQFGTFLFKTQEYTEKLEFRKKTSPVRNRLGSNEQFNGAVNYETSICDRNGVEQHFEMGQYLWIGVWTHHGASPYDTPACLFSRKASLKDVKDNFTFPTLAEGAQGPQFIPPYSISRQGSIPHGNAVQLFGSQPLDPNIGIPYKDIPGAPVIADLWDEKSVAFDKTMGYTAEKLRKATNNTRVKPDIASYSVYQGVQPKDGFPAGTLDPNSGEAYMKRIFNATQQLNCSSGTVVTDPLFPYCVQPNLKLVDANKGLDIISHDHFTLNTNPPNSTGLQGGSLNNVAVDRYAKIFDIEVRVWISKVKDKQSGKIVDQLQYEQRIHFEFQYGVDGTKTKWPHYQCNTLRRLEDL
ncbi:MAG: hypothetical protein ACI96W_001556 [Paraglaciecola sp.]|jgi:hypothetical protein